MKSCEGGVFDNNPFKERKKKRFIKKKKGTI